MFTNTTYGEPTPQAFIAIKKNRLKGYQDGNSMKFYLADETEFQIELFNPKSKSVLAKVELEGENITLGGIILKPGERVFLERNMDVAKKLKFEVYEVESGNAEVTQAIRLNGNLTIRFFDEIVTRNVLTKSFNRSFGTPNNTGGIFYNAPLNNFNYSDLSNNSSGSYVDLNSLSFKTSSVNATTDGLFGNNLNTSIADTKSVETGKVGFGGHSSQSFVEVEGNFQVFCSDTVTIKLLPISLKESTVEDVNVKVYCGNCGVKQKKNNNFCPSCGGKL